MQLAQSINPSATDSNVHSIARLMFQLCSRVVFVTLIIKVHFNMAANPAAAAAANPAAARGGQTNEHVEFSVRAAEDLYLEGSLKTIRRVSADTNYSCLMLKTQRFSSLFRHYAKYHGLRKDDLQYHFVNVLKNDDTPESVQLQRNDVIIVRNDDIVDGLIH